MKTFTDRDVYCTSCGADMITDLPKDICCTSRDCPCQGRDQRTYYCENCKDKHELIKQSLKRQLS